MYHAPDVTSHIHIVRVGKRIGKTYLVRNIYRAQPHSEDQRAIRAKLSVQSTM